MDHFENPRHTGEIADADGVASVGNPACGDMMKLFLKIENGRLADVKYKTFGCAAAIATSSAAAELVLGKTVEEAELLTKDDIVSYLDGLPEQKINCSTLAPEAVRKAIADWRHNKV